MGIEQHFPDDARNLIHIRSKDLLESLGISVLREITADVLCGINVRSATEMLTKRRINLLNGAILSTYVSLHESGIDSGDIASMAHDRLMERGLSRDDQTLLRWMLGATGKQFQNVLRSDAEEWSEYLRKFQESLREDARQSASLFGEMPLQLGGERLPWEWVLSMMMAAGSQTLSTRGSEKSMYGKLFEKLILTSTLSTLGFRYTEPGSVSERSFWLSSRGDKRESDATAIWNLGHGVRFDIGFIGSGNPEITLDKVSRFERMLEMGGVDHFMHTFIIVDRVGAGSSIPDLAEQIDGTIIQMSANNWVQTLGDRLADVLDGYASPLRGMGHEQYRAAIRDGVGRAPLDAVLS